MEQDRLESEVVVGTVGRVVVSGLQVQDAAPPLDQELVRVIKPCLPVVVSLAVVDLNSHNLQRD